MAIINSQIARKNCVQYVMIAALNHETISKHLEKITEIKPFINQCKWKDINFPAEAKDWKKFVINNKTITFNISSSVSNREENKKVYISKYNSEH